MGARKKVTVVGSGFVGSTCAHWIASREIADVILIDINEGSAKGKALDLYQSSPVFGFDSVVKGGSDYSMTKDSDVVVITAGMPRKPGMSRDDLLKVNAKIMKDVCEQIKKSCPQSIVIVVSNPLDAMTYVAKKTLSFPRERIFGMAGVLDTARFCTFVSEATKVSVKDVHALVLGGHGDTMVPLPRHCFVGGVPLQEVLSKKEIDAIIERTKKGGAEIVGYMKTGSAYFAPSASAAQMVESVIRDQKRILPTAAYLDGEYGEKNIFVGVPCKLGSKGLEQVIELRLNDEEKNNFKSSVEAVKKLITQLEALKY